MAKKKIKSSQIRISKGNKKLLDLLKIHKRETYEDVIVRLAHEYQET